ncbi:glycosyltransferase family 2 protein [Desnuesiella massiliensis]|uniref:glycosyltransferase family 2 protein n=1 Tax=Desnuesiella massiliensis TaxID=1650662 RepID=UPI0006E31CD3|nr:glycosyltransferase family 2 protein [Desnuesiella massiliensis]
MNKLISVVIPMYFEEKVVNECYSRLTKVMKNSSYDYELIFVNDGSTDNTLEMLSNIAQKDSRVKVIDFSRNFGHQIAVTAGIDRARGEAVVVIDADLQDPPELIYDMIKKWEEGYEVVYAKRKKREGETFFKLITAKYFYKFLNFMSDIDIPKDTGDFRLMDRKVVEVFKNMPEKNRFIRGMVSWLGFKQTYVEFTRQERFAGETKYPLKKMLKLAEDGIISFSHKPIKMITKLGVLFMGIFFLQLIYIFVALIVSRNIAPAFYVVTYINLITSIILMAIGIEGKYIVRIYDENNKRPLYIVNKEINMKIKNDVKDKYKSIG